MRKETVVNPTEGKVLTIKRSKWQRGCPPRVDVDTNQTALLITNTGGKMCCLGFDARLCGFKPAHIEGIDSPESLFEQHRNQKRFEEYFATRTEVIADSGYNDTYAQNTKLVERAININDHADLTDEKREKLLIPVLKKIGGYKSVVFVD